MLTIWLWQDFHDDLLGPWLWSISEDMVGIHSATYSSPCRGQGCVWTVRLAFSASRRPSTSQYKKENEGIISQQKRIGIVFAFVKLTFAGS
jgi:hypothetical protein